MACGATAYALGPFCDKDDTLVDDIFFYGTLAAPKLVNGSHQCRLDASYQHVALTATSYDKLNFPELIDGTSIFSSTNFGLTDELSINMPKAVLLDYAFSNSIISRVVKADLSSCTQGESMFQDCLYHQGIDRNDVNISYTLYTPKLKYATRMFGISADHRAYNTIANSLNVIMDLSSLENASDMFTDCRNLSQDSWTVIADTIKDQTASTGRRHIITFGEVAAVNGLTQSEENHIRECLKKIEDKGWEIEYTWGGAVITLDLDSEPILWYCRLDKQLFDEEKIEKHGYTFNDDNCYEFIEEATGLGANIKMFTYVTRPENYFACYSQADAMTHWGLQIKE